MATEHLALRRQITKHCSFFFFNLINQNHLETRAYEDWDIFPQEKNAAFHSAFFILKDLKTHFYKLCLYNL